MSHGENLLQTIKATLQDIVAPDVRELKVRMEALESRMDARFATVDAQFKAVDARFDAVDKRFDTMDKRFDAVNDRISSLELHLRDTMDANLKAILAAVAQSRAENEVMILRQLASLSERVAALEGVRH